MSAFAIVRGVTNALADCVKRTVELMSGLCSRAGASSHNSAADSYLQTVLARTEVLRLESSPDCVTRAVLLRGPDQITVQAKVFVLAAGAIHTPKLLLDSHSEHWPDGLANRSGLVGRNLMFHAMQRFAMWPSKRLAGSGPRKSIGFRDLYRVEGERFGSVQSTGFEVEYGDLLVHLYGVFDHSAFRRLRIVRPLLRIPAALAVLLFWLRDFILLPYRGSTLP